MTADPVRPVVFIAFGVGEYQARLINGITPELGRHGIPLITYAMDTSMPGIPAQLEGMLTVGTTAGVITSPGAGVVEGAALHHLLRSARVPTVHIGQTGEDCTSVWGDSSTGMRQLMDHLLDECGVRRPALVRGITHQPDSIVREKVFREVMDERGLPIDEELIIDGVFVQDLAYQAMSQLLKRRRDMDAVVALNDASAFGVLDALADVGLTVPDDVLVTGFDDEHVATVRLPGLTTVSHGVDEQGTLAASLLLEHIRTGQRQADQIIPSRLVVRGSTTVSKAPIDVALANALTANKFMQVKLTVQDTLLTVNRALFRCRTTGEVVQALTSCLDRIGITNGDLALYEAPQHGGGRGKESVDHARIVLNYRNGVARRPPDELFPGYRLLPDRLREDFPAGPAVLLPLAGLDRNIGYLLFEQVGRSASMIEVLRHDLSRALDSVFSTQERDKYTADLERLVAYRTRKLEQVNAELQRSLMMDGLTRIANRTAFERHLEHHWKVLARERQEMALLIVDVDQFKAYNDHYGHVLGDDALRVVADCLRRSARRPADLTARYGGEEFTVVLPHSGINAAMIVAQRFRALLTEAAIPHAASTVAPVVTASVGIAARHATPDGDHGCLVKVADEALYRAKAAGRNQIIAWSDPINPLLPCSGEDRAG